MRKFFILGALLMLAACQTTSGGTELTTAMNFKRGPVITESNLDPAAAPNSVPAIILMHGCTGIESNVSDWAADFVAQGWHVVVMDSNSPRFNGDTCGSRPNPKGPTNLERAADAYAALDYLHQNSAIDKSRIYLLGWSDGAIAAGLSASKNVMGFWNRTDADPRYAGVVSIYPSCWEWFQNGDLEVPTLVVGGSADDWTPVSECVSFANQSKRSDIKVHVIDGATHSFDIFRNRSGVVLSSRIFKGHRLIPSQSATNEAKQVVGEFLGIRL